MLVLINLMGDLVMFGVLIYIGLKQYKIRMYETFLDITLTVLTVIFFLIFFGFSFGYGLYWAIELFNK